MLQINTVVNNYSRSTDIHYIYWQQNCKLGRYCGSFFWQVFEHFLHKSLLKENIGKEKCIRIARIHIAYTEGLTAKPSVSNCDVT